MAVRSSSLKVVVYLCTAVRHLHGKVQEYVFFVLVVVLML